MMTNFIVSRILVSALLVTTVLGYVDIERISKKSPNNAYFYVLIGNYTVEPDIAGGVFSVDQMSLGNPIWVILYTKSNASSITSKDSCQEPSFPDPNILRVYTNQTTVTDGGPPDVYRVESDTVLCYMILNQKERHLWMGKIKFSYRDSGKTGTKSFQGGMSEYQNNIRMKFRYLSSRVCYHSLMKPSSVAVDYPNRMNDKTSLDRVGVSFGKITPVKARQSCSYRCEYYYEIHYYHLRTVTPQTPGDLQWPLILVNGTGVCFHFESTTFVKEQPVSDRLPPFRVSEFPICNGTIVSSQGGVIASPGYPKHPYATNLFCTWTIEVLPGQTIALEFEDAESDCGNDYVQLDGLEDGRKAVCGPSMNGKRFQSATNIMTVTFKTNVFQQLKGFLLRFSAIGCSLRNVSFPPNSIILNKKNPEVIRPGYTLRVGCLSGYGLAGGNDEVSLMCIADRTWSAGIPFCVKYPSCNLTLSEPTGSLASPGYPGYYPKNTTCAWKIGAKFGQRIKLELKHIESDCENDYITISGLSQPEDNLTDLTTKKEPPRNLLICGQNAIQGTSYTSQAHEMTVLFQSGLYKGEGFFNMTYQAIGCTYDSIRLPAGSLITNEAGFYPTGYKLNVECVRGFRFPIGERTVVLTCMITGRWKGRVPLCVRSQDVSNASWD